jgi:pimeloyl-ACP methyl ester carboxylesterase
MKTRPRIRRIWIPLLAAIILAIFLTLFLWPETLPENEGQRIDNASRNYDAVIIFNPGGWGNATLEQSTDFTPILENIRQTLTGLGYHPTIIAYARTPHGLSGRISDIKEYLNDFKNVSAVQARDLEYAAGKAPNKRWLLVGFSNGGGLTARTIEVLDGRSNVDSILAGVPFWYRANPSTDSLVLNNQGQDTLAAGDLKEIVINILKAPFRWISAKIQGRDLNLALSFEFPGHVYNWSSPEVGPPITGFLDANFNK